MTKFLEASVSVDVIY